MLNNIERLMNSPLGERATLTVVSPAGHKEFHALLLAPNAEPGHVWSVKSIGATLGGALESVNDRVGEKFSCALAMEEGVEEFMGVKIARTRPEEVAPGQRVILVESGDDSDAGQTGTVLGSGATCAPWIRFDTPVRYKTSRFGKEARGFVDCVSACRLRLLVDQTPNPYHTTEPAEEDGVRLTTFHDPGTP